MKGHPSVERRCEEADVADFGNEDGLIDFTDRQSVLHSGVDWYTRHTGKMAFWACPLVRFGLVLYFLQVNDSVIFN